MKSHVKFAVCVALLLPALAGAQRREGKKELFGCAPASVFEEALQSANGKKAVCGAAWLNWTQHVKGKVWTNDAPIVLSAKRDHPDKVKHPDKQKHANNGNHRNNGNHPDNGEHPEQLPDNPCTEGECVAAVPEPITVILLATGMGSVGLAARRRRALKR